MARFVALLGGINVGGHRVTMDRLRTEVTALGFTDVATFIASGNVLFTGPARGNHEVRIQDHLAEQLGWPVPTFVRTAAEVITASDLRPFGATPPGHTRVTLTGWPTVPRTSGGRITATGRGSAIVPMTVSPETARPAPAGHRCGRRTKAWTTSVTADRASTAPTISRSVETRMQLRL